MVARTAKDTRDTFGAAGHTPHSQVTRDLELKEIAPLKSGPYDAAASSYMVYDFAIAIRKMILKQSARYKWSTGPGLYLLLYVTDWRFLLSPSVVTLLRHWALHDRHCFQRIYVYQVRERHEGMAKVIYPEVVPAGFDPECRGDGAPRPAPAA